MTRSADPVAMELVEHLGLLRVEGEIEDLSDERGYAMAGPDDGRVDSAA